MSRSAVIDSRSNADGDRIRRRRTCTACGHRWTTYEVDAALLHAMSEASEGTSVDVLMEDLASAIALIRDTRQKAASGALGAGPQRYYFDKRRLTFPGTPAPKTIDGKVLQETGEQPVNKTGE